MTPIFHRIRAGASARAQALALALPCVLAVGLWAGDLRAACNPDPPMDDDAVVCDGADSTGYDASGATRLTITNSGVTVLDDSSAGLDSAILISDDNVVDFDSDVTIDVVDPDGAGIEGGDLNMVDFAGTLTISGTATNGVGIRLGDNGRVENIGSITLDGVTGVAIQGDDLNELYNRVGGTITINGAGGVAILGLDDNFVQNDGDIALDADDTRGLSIRNNTLGFTTGLPGNGAVNEGNIVVNGDRSYAIEAGNDSGVATSGTIDLLGNETRGISVGSRTDFGLPANLTNTATGTIEVMGNDSYGIKAGDGWVEGSINPATMEFEFIPGSANAAGARNFGTINVSGARSFGLFVGDENNPVGNNNSFVRNAGTLDVTGVDAIGISLGGNDLLPRLDFDASDTIFQYDLVNSGTIQGGADAGPLVEFRAFVAGHENRILNSNTGEILADLTNQGTADRAIAIRGTAGDELVLNFGAIQGDVELGAGDDRFLQTESATITGMIRGGAGTDELVLSAFTPGLGSFDVSVLDSFEAIRIQSGASPWTLSNAAGFTGTTTIESGGRLQVPTPLTLGGSLVVERNATVQVTLASSTPPLTVVGDATFAGTLQIDIDPALPGSATPYRVIQVNGTRIGEFDSIVPPSPAGTFVLETSYDAMGVIALYEDLGFVGVARGANQRSIAQHMSDIEIARGATPDLQSIIDELSASTGTLSYAYQAFSPEAYDAQTTLLVEGGRRVARLLFERPRECEVGQVDPWTSASDPLPCHARRWAPWLAAVGSFRSRDGHSQHPRYDAQLGGLVAGIDSSPIGGLDLTFAISSQRGQVDVSGAQDSTLTLIDLTAGAAYRAGPLRVQAAFGWGHGFHDDRRLIRFEQSATPVDVRGTDDHESDRLLLAGELGALFELGPIGIEPIVGIDWTWVDQDSISESDAGGLGLRVSSRDDSVGSIDAGVRLSSSHHQTRYLGPNTAWMDGVWRGHVDVRWRQFLEGDQRDIDARFVGSPDTVPGFTIQGEEDDGGVEIAAGLSFVPEHANRLEIALRYEAFVADNTLAQDLVARLTLGF